IADSGWQGCDCILFIPNLNLLGGAGAPQRIGKLNAESSGLVHFHRPLNEPLGAVPPGEVFVLSSLQSCSFTIDFRIIRGQLQRAIGLLSDGLVADVDRVRWRL